MYSNILPVLLVLLCAYTCCWTIELSDPVTSVPYDSSEIAVWQNERGKYFFMPLVQMMNNSAKVVQNVLTGRLEINIGILMWSVQAKEAVLLYLKQHMNSSLVDDDVKLLPVRKVRLLWKDRLRPLDSAYQLANHWRSNTASPSVLTFQIICSEMEKCDSLKNALNTSPDVLYALELDYVLNVDQTRRRMVSVTGNHVIGGELYRKLSSMTSTSPIRYLTSTDILTLARQTVANAISDVITDKNYVDNGDEASLCALLQKVWQRHSISASTLLPSMWTSVYWTPTGARPEKLVRSLNRVLTNDPDNSENFLLDSSWKSSEELDVLDLRGVFNTTSSDPSVSNTKTRISKSVVLRKLRDDKEGRSVLWSGDEFRVRPIPLYRLNLASVNVSRRIVSGHVEVREYESVRSVRVRPPGSRTQTTDLTTELVQSRIQESVLRTLRVQLNQTRTSMEGMLNTNRLNLETEFQTRIATIAGVFDSWPDYCHVQNYYCGNSVYIYATFTSVTLDECKRQCELSSRCKSFLFRSTGSPPTLCRLRHFICPHSQLKGASHHNYYIKVSRVPTINAEMWKSAFLNSTLRGVLEKPCEVMGFHNYVTG